MEKTTDRTSGKSSSPFGGEGIFSSAKRRILGVGRWRLRGRDTAKFGGGKHAYSATQGAPGAKKPETIIRHFTQQDLDVKRARNRRRNKAARASRKANR